mmetsp:Transcript_31485/g.82570  ORF Transcript_31485/g.82570 Transcript_31485/m.82570 type:complete len:348 (-) Transcript_31485:1918-2961(-)
MVRWPRTANSYPYDPATIARPPVLDHGFTSEETTTTGVSRWRDSYPWRVSSGSPLRSSPRSSGPLMRQSRADRLNTLVMALDASEFVSEIMSLGRFFPAGVCAPELGGDSARRGSALIFAKEITSGRLLASGSGSVSTSEGGSSESEAERGGGTNAFLGGSPGASVQPGAAGSPGSGISEPAPPRHVMLPRASTMYSPGKYTLNSSGANISGTSLPSAVARKTLKLTAEASGNFTLPPASNFCAAPALPSWSTTARRSWSFGKGHTSVGETAARRMVTPPWMSDSRQRTCTVRLGMYSCVEWYRLSHACPGGAELVWPHSRRQWPPKRPSSESSSTRSPSFHGWPMR